MYVAEWVTRPVISLRPEESLQEAQARFQHARQPSLPVLQRGKLIGLLSDCEMQSALPSPATTLSVQEVRGHLRRLRVAAVMTPPGLTVLPYMPLQEAARLMYAHHLEALPVVNARHFIGMLTRINLLEALCLSLRHTASWHPASGRA